MGHYPRWFPLLNLVIVVGIVFVMHYGGPRFAFGVGLGVVLTLIGVRLRHGFWYGDE